MEDIRRHRRAWIVAGERLHPGEYARRWPAVALAFAVLCGTKLNAPLCPRVSAHHHLLRRAQQFRFDAAAD